MSTVSANVDDSKNSDDDGSMVVVKSHCTFAVTGPTVQWQSIYICRDCEIADAKGGAGLKCLCEACADLCHADHDIEYVGMGPSYCDCGADEANATSTEGGCCQIAQVSRDKAQILGCAASSRMGVGKEPSASSSSNNGPAPLVEAQAFRIAALEGEEACQRLILQAQAFIGQSKDSHWVDANANEDDLCELEQLALRIFRQHTGTNEEQDIMPVGAEWWVQVKDLSSENSAVDLHYDKDENLVEAFSLGYFPKLSTVTYLTEQAYPTLVFPHRFDEPEEEQMDSLIVSHPKRGKHLLFDGRLLHGAPACAAMSQQQLQEDGGHKSLATGLRVTFLVNVWHEPQPSGIKAIDQGVREAIKQAVSATETSERSSFTMKEKPIPFLELAKEEDLPEEWRDRIELPFVSKGATWVNDDESNNLVLVTFPPPQHDSDTVNVKFGPGMQAYLDYKEEEDDHGGEASAKPGPHFEHYV